MELTAPEHAFMRNSGSILIPAAEPVDYDRTDVIYPMGIQISEDGLRAQLLVNQDHQFEPLAAGLGRYVLHGTCGYLRTNIDGWD